MSQVRRVHREIPKTSVVFDLYSGTGTIAQILAPVAKESDRRGDRGGGCRRQPKKTRPLNGLANCDFIAGDVLAMLDEI